MEKKLTNEQVKSLVTWHKDLGDRKQRMRLDNTNCEDYTCVEQDLFEAFYNFNEEIIANNNRRNDEYDAFLREKGLIL